MTKEAGRTRRRHVREKATIDHLVHGVAKPKPPDEKHSEHSRTTAAGLPVEEQIRKEWDPKKGGSLLPTHLNAAHLTAGLMARAAPLSSRP